MIKQFLPIAMTPLYKLWPRRLCIEKPFQTQFFQVVFYQSSEGTGEAREAIPMQVKDLEAFQVTNLLREMLDLVISHY